MMQPPIDPKLSKKEMMLFDKLYVLLKVEGKNTFSSDDFRAYGLIKFLEDPAHEMGAFIFRCKKQKLIVDDGFVHSVFPSNHGRRIGKYKIPGLDAAGPLLTSFARNQTPTPKTPVFADAGIGHCGKRCRGWICDSPGGDDLCLGCPCDSELGGVRNL